MTLRYLLMDGCNVPIETTFPNNACNIILSGIDYLGANYPIPAGSAVWTSNNPSVASPQISSDGLIMGHSDGVAIITATYLGRSVSKSVSVGTGIQNPSGNNIMTYAVIAAGIGFLYFATKKN